MLTALVTGLYNFYWLMNVVHGAPINPLNCAALLGSVTLLGAGVLMLSRRAPIAVKIGLAGALLLWFFYAPLIVVSLGMLFSTWLEMRAFASSRDYAPLVGLLGGPILLVAATVILARTRRSA